ncbi:FAD-dependent oxidoreductase [Curtobacterium albidum]|uniref:ferredoxin--NADP(+) reductase n=1 Tax=Curtobacterium citreum TaxID=2036 RepID=A0A850DRD1_9MICO|nr:FAD-dependent oxidoreductase [Curtobacterium albidum]NUU27189.1 FAD-dependent oxidoreductase [Curtobacterium albidum]
MLSSDTARAASSRGAIASPGSIAIVGSGPSGCYSAQMLKKHWPDAEIVVFDSSPVPYGLVRYGIAPDHHGNKAVTAQFDRIFDRQGVHFRGGVEIGTDISYETLVEAFDVTVLATGREQDRPLAIPTAAEARIIGAGTIMRALNGFPEHAGTMQSVGPRVAIVGAGNVAMDVVRMLTAPIDVLRATDIHDATLSQLRSPSIERIDVISRSGVDATRFDLAMLREVCQLPGVLISASGPKLDLDHPVAELLREAARQTSSTAAKAIEIRFWFDTVPMRIDTVGNASVLHVRREDTSVEIMANTVVTAIGFEHATDRPSQAAVDGRADVFHVGWRRRGAVGGVAANRACAREVTTAIIECFNSGNVPRKHRKGAEVERILDLHSDRHDPMGVKVPGSSQLRG